MPPLQALPRGCPSSLSLLYMCASSSKLVDVRTSERPLKGHPSRKDGVGAPSLGSHTNLEALKLVFTLGRDRVLCHSSSIYSLLSFLGGQYKCGDRPPAEL